MNPPRINKKIFETSRSVFDYGKKTIVMGILNTTPDSFWDGGKYTSVDDALRQAERLLDEGADILDIGGESTRPGGGKVRSEDELRRVIPVIEGINKRFDAVISVDTWKSDVAAKAVEAGAEIINDISGLRFDEKIAEIAAVHRTGLVLMHSRGDFETMHQVYPETDVISGVTEGLGWSIRKARSAGVKDARICLDVGIGFGKTQDQNLELLALLEKLCSRFSEFPMMVGLSRKSFIGKILDGVVVDERLSGTLAANAVAVYNGANMLRVHDVKANLDAIKVAEALRNRGEH